MFNKNKLQSMIDSLKHRGTQKCNMLLFGAAIGWTRYPLFMLNNKFKILPRQVVSSRYGNKGHNVYKLEWFKELVQIAEYNVKIFISKNINFDARFHELKKNVQKVKPLYHWI